MEHFLSKSLLLTSSYLHFYIEHNRGHHKRVATRSDPATAGKDETLYFFWLGKVVYSYISALQLESQRLNHLGSSWLSLRNVFLQFQLVQILFLLLIYWLFGSLALTCFQFAAIIGILMLETINYVEHYGLVRSEITNGVFEKVAAKHSWNDDHILSRCLLFQLSRHSHHHLGSRLRYEKLKSEQDAPELPSGYRGMMIPVLFPPLRFRVMNKRLSNT